MNINGRLARRGIDVQSVDDFKAKMFDRLLAQGRLSQADLTPFDEAWASEGLTYADILALTKQLAPKVRSALT